MYEFFRLNMSLVLFIGVTKSCIIIWKREQISKLLQRLSTGILSPNYDRGGIEEYNLINSAINTVHFMVRSLAYKKQDGSALFFESYKVFIHLFI